MALTLPLLSEPVYVNVSEINDFANCRFRWWAKWIMGREPIHDSVPLNFGTLLHRIFEEHNEGMTMEAAIRRRRAVAVAEMNVEMDTFNREVMAKAIKTLDDLTEALLLWKDQYPFEIPCLEVENSFEYHLMPGVVLRGRPDRVGVMDGRIWHVQHKGLAAGTHFGIYKDLAQRSYHEHSYLHVLAEKYPQYKVGGTLFDLVRKLKYRTYVGKKNETTKSYEEMFMQFPMSIELDSPVHLHVMSCIKSHIGEMLRVRADWTKYGLIPAPNEAANGGFFHNKPDEYFRVLTGEIELDDPRYFRARVDTYAQAEEE